MICYDYVNNYIRETIQKSDGILKELEEYAMLHHVPIIQPEVARLLFITGRLVKPKRILEVGTAIGYSAILMSQILEPGGKIDTIDRSEKMTLLAKENIKKARMEDRINIITGDALDVLQCLDKSYDMIFMDAAKGQYSEFLPECLRMLKSNGVLFSDNVLYKGMVASDELIVFRKKTIVKRMREYLEVICNSEELDSSIIPIGDGVAISYKIR
jgi:predicted O-methyltransferase YrrM